MPIKTPQMPARRFAGKRVLFHGKFERGEPAGLAARAAAVGATVVTALTANVDIVVLPDALSGKTIRQKAQSLNARGASIQVVDANTFRMNSVPTPEDLLALIRGGKANAATFREAIGGRYTPQVAGTGESPLHRFIDERFDGLDLEEFDFEGIVFERCRFVGAKLGSVTFDVARECDFSKAMGDHPTFKDVSESKFVGAKFESASFEGSLDGADFSSARLDEPTFYSWHIPTRRGQKVPVNATVFRKATLTKAEFDGMTLVNPDFAGAGLTSAKFEDVELRSASFRGAKLKGASLLGCKLPGADLSNADLRGANLANADLTGGKLAGADVAGCNLRGAKIEASELKKARGLQPGQGSAGGVGPSLQGLDGLGKQATHLEVTFHLHDSDGEEDEVSVVGPHKFGFGARAPFGNGLHLWRGNGRGKQSFSDAMMRLANAFGHRAVRYETVRISGIKLPKRPKELQQLALGGIAEAFGQPLPDARALAAATKAHRDKAAREAEAAKRKAAALGAEKQKREAAAKARAIERIAKEAGAVGDFESFMKAIVVRTDADKVLKASKMLKASRFQLFNQIAADHLLGVVKSQTDPDLVYACRIDQDGHYACCTQNLNICGGLRGSVCKHLLVLIIGLVHAGELDAATIDGWVAKTHGVKPAIDREVMSEIFIRYKGAEAGEVDWRPTETVPEDYYAL